MQNGSVIRAQRQRGPDVWEFRWREPGADGKRKHRRMVLGSIEQLTDEEAARQAIPALQLELNRGGAWLKTRSMTVSELVFHYRERELRPDTVWKTYSTQGDVRGVSEEMDSATLEKLSAAGREVRPSRAVAETAHSSTRQQGENQKYYERLVQSCHSLGMGGSQSNYARTAECDTQKDSSRLDHRANQGVPFPSQRALPDGCSAR
jgi:hypothetical protein